MSPDQRLIKASDIGDVALARQAISDGADIDTLSYGWTALTRAARSGSLLLVQLLIKSGADVNLESSDVSPLIMAACNGEVETVDYLLKCGADPNIISQVSKNSGLTCMIEPYLEIVKLLVKYGANIDHINAVGDTIMSLALDSDHDELIDFLTTYNMRRHPLYSGILTTL